VFDGELKEKLDDLYPVSVWSSVGDDLKEIMVEALTNALVASDMEVELFSVP